MPRQTPPVKQKTSPGLIDLHTHVYHSATCWGVRADPVAARTGVTTWLDVGSAGAYNFPGFREFIVRPSLARIYAHQRFVAVFHPQLTGAVVIASSDSLYPIGMILPFTDAKEP